MAISATYYYVVRSMFEQGLLPQAGALLELGEANWYKQIAQEFLAEDIRRLVGDPSRRDRLLARLAEIMTNKEATYLFDISKVFYELFFAPSNVQAVDFEGTRAAHRLDLNHPITLDRRFNVVFNHGTAEHIFNIAQVFKTIHDYTLVGGLMIHESPFTGWIDHGFYSLQPTLFFDLAAVNNYAVLGMFVEDLTSMKLMQLSDRDAVATLARSGTMPANTMLVTVLRRGPDEPAFGLPIQGVYGGALSQAGMDAWRELR
jgi:hypothetical protein